MSAPLVSLREVTVVRGGRPVLSNIDLRIDSGECVAILGPNGCGKSTLVRLIAGDLRARAGQGEVRILGMERWNLFDLRASLGIVSNDLQGVIQAGVMGLDVVLSGFLGSYGLVDPARVSPEMRDKALAALDRVEAGHLFDRPYGELSSGEARRILVARALAHDPHTLLLDEPTTSLDIRAANEFLGIVRRLAGEGIGIILVTHHFEDIVPEIERVILLKHGRVYADGPKHEALTSDRISNLFETPICISGGDPLRAEIAVHTAVS